MNKKVEIFVILLLFTLAFYSAVIVGSPIDEPYEMTIGKERLKYLLSFGSYTDFDFYRYEKFYPGLYNTIAIFFTKFFPHKYEIVVWHLTNTIFSIFTIFGISKVASLLFNKQIGKIVFLLCFLNPIFFGHMAINSKDTIIALANVWFVYASIKYLQKQSANKNANYYVLIAGLLLGLGTGVRLQFFATLIPWIFFIFVDIFFLKKITNTNFLKKKLFIDIFKVLLIGYVFAISAWSYTHINILVEPFKLFFEQMNFKGLGVNWILYNGNFFNTLELPASYIFINLLYKTPEFFLLCLIILIFTIILDKNFYSSKFNFFLAKLFLLLSIIIFPILVFIFLPYRVYDGLRLFFYIVPYFNLLGAIAIYYLINNMNLLISKILSLLVSILLIYYVFIFVSLTPYQYTYLNKFIGSKEHASKKFENEYWGVSIKELVKKIPLHLIKSSKDEKIKIAFCGIDHKIVKKELNKLKDFEYEVYDFFSKDYDYSVMTNRSHNTNNQNTPDNVKTCFDLFKGTDLVTVKRNGITLSTIRKKN